jgi:hypothetical protein
MNNTDVSDRNCVWIRSNQYYHLSRGVFLKAKVVRVTRQAPSYFYKFCKKNYLFTRLPRQIFNRRSSCLKSGIAILFL